MDSPPYTLEEWLRLHPRPSDLDGKRIEYLWHFDVDLDPDDLWRVIADTSRVNRALGTAQFHFEDKGGQRIGRSRPAGVRHEWTEKPWNWVAGQWLEMLRVYERGFMKVAHGVQRIERRPDGGARLYTYFGFVPRSAIGAAAIRMGFPSTEKDYRRILPAIAAEHARGVPSALLLPPPAMPPDTLTRLAAIVAQLREQKQDSDVVDHLVEWVRTGDEQDLMRIQVRERALAWGVDEDVVLSVFLHATRAGLLELSWDVVCPHCRGAVTENPRAELIRPEGQCEVCAIDFETDDAIEITFHVHPSIRVIERRMFCASEPAFKGHIRVQQRVAPGARAEVSPHLSAGRWRMRLDGSKKYGYLDTGKDAAAAIEWKASEPPREQLGAIDPRLTLINDTDAEVSFVVEASTWSDIALRPGRLLSFQEFRDLFGEEYLGADVQLSVGEQTILFTDMVGSTAMYAARGDPGAFIEVKKHFDELFAIIRRHRGAVVKTIGDAAMGAFNDPLDAVRCSREIHHTFPPTRTDLPVRLRISLNTGPCIAVKLNANIDYFGGTVNVAAKLQALAESWQVALPLSTWRSPGVAEWITAQGGTVEDVEYVSKALPAAVIAKRWTVWP
jgi:class 3 adenylate cyclase